MNIGIPNLSNCSGYEKHTLVHIPALDAVVIDNSDNVITNYNSELNQRIFVKFKCFFKIISDPPLLIFTILFIL
jgi:hypothetical protein